MSPKIYRIHFILGTSLVYSCTNLDMAAAGSSTWMNLEDSSSDEGAVEVTPGTQEVVEIISDDDNENESGPKAKSKAPSPGSEIIIKGDEKEEGEASDGEIREDDDDDDDEEEEDGNTVTENGDEAKADGGGGAEVVIAAAPTATKPAAASLIVIYSDDEDGEVDGKAAQRALISEAMAASSGRDVKEKDLRFFQADDVICSHCGLRGHLSYDCEEEVVKERCNMCGADDHMSFDCPNDTCYRCGQRGHMAKDCRDAHKREKQKPAKPVVYRNVSPARNIPPLCYVCGSTEHADCSLMHMPTIYSDVSCFNCGMDGHVGQNCEEPRAERWTYVVGEMDRERRRQGKHRNKTKFKKGMTDEQKEEQRNQELQVEKDQYRTELIERIRTNTRNGPRRDYGGGGRGGGGGGHHRSNHFHRGGRGNNEHHGGRKNHNTNKRSYN